MTEKELLYVEDAIGHEDNVIAYLNNAVDGLKDKSLVRYLKSEIKKHESLRERLLDTLKGCCND